MGAINYLQLIEVANLANTITKLKEAGFWVYGTSLYHSSAYYDVNYDQKTCFVVGKRKQRNFFINYSSIVI